MGDGAYLTIHPSRYAVLTANHHDPAQASDAVYLDSGALKNLLAALKEYE